MDCPTCFGADGLRGKDCNDRTELGMSARTDQYGVGRYGEIISRYKGESER